MAKRVAERWSEDDTSALLSVWEERMDDYRYEKKAFYVAAAERIAGKDWKSVKNRCEFLERRYESIRAKMSASGSSNAPTPRATILKELKWYYELHELLGARPNAEESCGQGDLPPTTGSDCHGNVASGVETRGADDPSGLDTDARRIGSGASGSSESSESRGARGANTNKRKAPESSITDVLRELGAQALAVERERLSLMRQQFEFDMLVRREELELRREKAEQRRQEFELKLQTMKAQYELDRSRWAANLHKSP